MNCAKSNTCFDCEYAEDCRTFQNYQDKEIRERLEITHDGKDECKPSSDCESCGCVEGCGKAALEACRAIITTHSRSDKDLLQIAKDIDNNVIFTTGHLRSHEQNMISMVFMPLSMIDRKELEALLLLGVSFFYAPNAKALPRSMNGLPIFAEYNILLPSDHKKMNDYYNKLQDAKKAVEDNILNQEIHESETRSEEAV